MNSRRVRDFNPVFVPFSEVSRASLLTIHLMPYLIT